jgi:hypothetical protein
MWHAILANIGNDLYAGIGAQYRSQVWDPELIPQSLIDSGSIFAKAYSEAIDILVEVVWESIMVVTPPYSMAFVTQSYFALLPLQYLDQLLAILLLVS